MDDNSLMPFGKHKGKKLANIPATYLVFMYDNNKLIGCLKEYVENNIDLLLSEIGYKKRSDEEQ